MTLLLYHKPFGLSRVFFGGDGGNRTLLPSRASSLVSSPSNNSIISQLGAVVKGFFYFFSRFLLAPKFLRSVPVLRVEEPLGVLSLPLTSLVYHRPHQKSTGDVAQLWEENLFDFCSFFLLTKSAGYDIMEFSTPYTRGRASENVRTRRTLS